MEILFKDETMTGELKTSFSVEVKDKMITVKDVIKLRVFEEVENYNKMRPEYFNSLVQPTDAEITLNGYRLKELRKIDAEKQYYLALDAFLSNSFFIIINNNQADDLEELVEIKDKIEISFIKLVPLVGG